MFLCLPAGIWTPNYRRSTSLNSAQQSKTTRLPDEQYGKTHSRNNKNSSSSAAANNTDSSSEISDEGYRTGVGAGDIKGEELDERPDSSCTQVSQTSSLESGVSSAGHLDDSDPVTTTTSNYKQEKTENKYNYGSSKIPFLGSLRAMGKGAFHYSTESNDSPRKSSDADSRLQHSNSSGHMPTNLSNVGFRRDAFGRHSLRARSTSTDCELKLNVKAAADSADQMTGSKSTLTWSGRNRRQRPSIQPSETTTSRNRNPLASSGPNYRSRSVNSGASRGQSRASSTSPTSRRRHLFIPSSSMYSGPNSPELKPIPVLKAPTSPAITSATNKPYSYVKQPTSPPAEAPKMSPLLRNMLKDVELDNDASILKKMEEIVNQYKARVESILAAEGKTLNDDLDYTAKVDTPSHNMNGSGLHNNEDARKLFTRQPATTKLSRRNSLDSSLSHLPTRMFASPRKDVVSQSPSKIPMPLFYRPRETCL